MNSRILKVDDTPKNIQVLGNILSDNGYNVEFALCGVDALEFIKETNFDLILLDVMMPEKDGFEVCTEIRQNKAYHNIPIIFLTAKNDLESLVKGFDLGGQDYLTKPFNAKELLARVKTHLDLKKHKDNLDELVKLRTHQLQQAYKELEVLDKAKVEFLNMLSHEIRTPLNGIIGFVELLKTQIDSGPLTEYLLHLTESAEKLEEFSLKALLITSLRTKLHQLHLEDINLIDLINNCILNIKSHLEDKSIKVQTSFSEPQIIIHADNSLITNCINEILKNILYHADKADQISIKVVEKKTQINIEIHDNGVGFSKKAISSIFKPFGFGDEHMNIHSGLGLHLVKLAMEAHNFQVKAGNNSDIGAFVHLILNK